jgi:hypothetical protein
MTGHVYITIDLFNLCQQSFLPFYIYFFKCWHRLNEPIIGQHKKLKRLEHGPTKKTGGNSCLSQYSSTWVHPRFFLCFPIMCLYVLRSVLWCPQRIPHQKTMFGLFLPPVFCWRADGLSTFYVLLEYSGVQHILFCVFALFVFVLCALCCRFLSVVYFRMVYLCWWFPDILLFDMFLKICAEYRLK